MLFELELALLFLLNFLFSTYHSTSWHTTRTRKNEFEDVKGRLEAMMNRNPKDDLYERAESLKFRVCVTTISVLRYLCEHMDALPSNLYLRMLDVHDILLGIIPLLENPPWTKRLDKVRIIG